MPPFPKDPPVELLNALRANTGYPTLSEKDARQRYQAACEVEDYRMLGACDGFAHALVRVRLEIGAIRYYPICPRHVRRIAAREAKLKPLREIEAWLVRQHTNTKAAYEARLKAAACEVLERKKEKGE